MANVKITDLTEDTTPANGDWIETVDISASSSKKVTRQNFLANLSFATTSLANPYKFRARRVAAQDLTIATFTKVQFDTEDFDTNNNFDVATNVGRYTAPVSGFYQINARLSQNPNPNSTLLIALYKNGTIYQRGSHQFVNSTVGVTYCDTIQLTAGDYIEIYGFSGNTGALEVSAGSQAYFSGFLISTT